MMRWRPFKLVGGIGAVVCLPLAGLALTPPDILRPLWVQSHPLLPNFGASDAATNPLKFDDTIFAYQPPPIIERPGYNVLLIYMESLSSLSLETGDMQYLTSLADTHISFDRYFSNQPITVNGLYATLTGDMPALRTGEQKWQRLEASSPIALDALPARFRDAGYHTAFLQSAELSYMSKSTVLPYLGFDTLRGLESWTAFNSKDSWGIDDTALFSNITAYASELDAETPWFIAALTTGTHPPYNVPQSFPHGQGNTPRNRALQYLDTAIQHLLDELEHSDLLNKTVVILTSDEGREPAMADGLRSDLDGNRLPLIVLHPSGAHARISSFLTTQRLPDILGKLMQSDVSSALEQLQSENAPIAFANFFSRRIHFFDPAEQTLVSCETGQFLCARFEGVGDVLEVHKSLQVEVATFPQLEADVDTADAKSPE